MFLTQMPGDVRAAAMEKIVSRVRSDDDYPWTSELVFALADSQNPDHLDLVRSKVDDYRIRGAVLIALARRPDEKDRDLFVAGLESASREVLESCLAALERLPASDDARELAALVKLARSLEAEQRDVPLRDVAARLLSRNIGVESDYEFASQQPQSEAIANWTRRLTERHPAVAAEYLGSGSDANRSFVSKLEQVNWNQGDAARGEELFVNRSCAQCHQGRGAVGPDLAGVTKRFSRADVLTAIVDPSRDVSTRYATTAIETTAGKVYTGLVIYESVDGVTLLDGLNQTIRIESDQIESQQTVNRSLMPAGLLEGLDPQDLADLFAYLAKL
jgi:putative heme-binding domain-containing protein